jgi:hypothetical protein
MRRTILLAALALLASALIPGAAPARPAPPAKPLPQAQAEALIGAPAAVSSGSETRAVSPQEALAAAALPGATTAVAPGLSLDQAVGVATAASTPAASVPAASVPAASAPAAPRSVQAPAAAAFIGCSTNAAWHQWGTWPYEQRITDTTYWCAVYGDQITYRSSSVSGTGTLCGTSWTTSQLISGGIGYSWFVMRSSAGFACPTVVPWVTLHPSHYEDIARNAWGSTAAIGSS